MITLDLNNHFAFTTKDQFGTETTYKGTFRELTKKELNDFKTTNKSIDDTIKKGQKLIESLDRINDEIAIKEKLEKWSDIETLQSDKFKLEDDLTSITDTFDADEEKTKMLKKRFELCLGGEQSEAIKELAETYGYDTIMDIIAKAVREGKLDQ